MVVLYCTRIAAIAMLAAVALAASEGTASEPDLTLVREVLDQETGLLRSVEDDRRILAGKLRAEVKAGLSAAQKLLADKPGQAEQNLKLMLETLERAPVDAEIRNQLRQQVTTAIRQARLRKTQQDHELAMAQEQHAAAAELERINAALETSQQRLKQIVDRFDTLMDEQRHTVADEQVAPEVQRLAPGSSLAASLASGGSLNRTVHESDQISRQRDHNFTRTLALVEQSLVPFPDEPPIVHLPAEQWEDLTRRRQKYKAIDLGKPGGSEQRIFNELNKTTNLDVAEMPLKDIVLYLSETHGIPIVLSGKKLEEAGVSADTPVTKSLRGVTLRSALRLLLKDLELTYVVRDEVL